MSRLSSGTDSRPGLVGRPDGLAAPQAEALARQLAPPRSSGTDDTFEPSITELGLPDLLGVRTLAPGPGRAVAGTGGARRCGCPSASTQTGAPVEA